MTATIVIPFAGRDEHRRAALAWVRDRWCREFSDFYLSVIGGFEKNWRKGEVVRDGVLLAPSELIIVADADVWCDPAAIRAACLAVAAGASDWSVPHRDVYRLSNEATARVLDGEEPTTMMPHSRKYEGRLGGGIVIASKETLTEIPMDSRFVGWGQEDESWAYALQSLAGQPWRGTADLFHLWHPTPPRLERRRGTAEGWRLMKRYRRAHGDGPEAMRKLVEECRQKA